MILFINLSLPIIRSIFKIRINTDYGVYRDVGYRNPLIYKCDNNILKNYPVQLALLKTRKIGFDITNKYSQRFNYYNIFKNTIDIQLKLNTQRQNHFIYILDEIPYKKYVNILSHLNGNMFKYLLYLYSVYLNNRIIIYDVMMSWEDYCNYNVNILFINDEFSYYYKDVFYKFDNIYYRYSFDIYNGEKYIEQINWEYRYQYSNYDKYAYDMNKYYNINLTKYIFDGDIFKKTYCEISKNLLKQYYR